MEIERKYLVNRQLWEVVRPTARKRSISQGYLATDPGRTVRVRVSGDQAYLTIKGPTHGISRSEFEYEIPVDEGLQLLQMVKTPLVIKDRFVIRYKGFDWEVDEFHGDHCRG
jgi:CYTH domain-containing protein